MKEIIYIQAGSLSNYVGTHFWNAQQSYFTYDEDEPVLINHDVSFREGMSPEGQSTFCPRLLQFDRKSNFGALSTENQLYRELQQEADAAPLWSGPVDEIRQDPIPGSSYQTQLDEEVDEEPAELKRNAGKVPAVPSLQSSDVRYWSDFNRVYYLPRSVHKLPDPADWENAEGDWNSGREAFQRYEVDDALLEDSFRLFVEECDTFQGLQLQADSDSFGAFSISFLTAFRDEYPKVSSLAFPVLCAAVPGDIDLDDARGTRNAFNDALLFRALNELSTMNIPLQNPRLWTTGSWSDGFESTLRTPYETSAILSAHIETATLPLRLKEPEPLFRLCNRLDLYGNTPFVELSGAFPEALDPRATHNYTHPEAEKPVFEWSVTRGLTEHEQQQFDDARTSLSVPFSSLHASVPYPLPSSYPSFFRRPDLNAVSKRTSRGIYTRPRTAPLVSSLGLSNALPEMFSRYTAFVDTCVRRRTGWQGVGIDEDDARELRDSLWVLRDNYGDAEASGDDLGEDEDAS
ncbi:tubulin nucleotide-binding domain-like protein [Auriscalpium vulgare]|uniref:Tubulin nucleotide-binding domain-like protein n=1 Tax=Auriscalpium vulgare TaxID=40419 RepID=A0ACB8S0H8_9AGAM|nr:tubulin nucleotide-binding domain-like protein [Auriscalpium vulgare]